MKVTSSCFLFCFFISLFFLSVQAIEFDITSMTLEEKVGQLLIVHFDGNEVNQEASDLIQNAHVGGIIYYNWLNELSSPEQVKKLSAGLQSEALLTRCQIPLFICVDQEGGRVQRLKKGFTQFPSSREVAEIEDRLVVKELFATMARELHSAGVNMNLAPVVDVNSNPKNPVIGDRSFSNDPVTVIVYGGIALQQFRENSIIGVLKHFPGHGDVEIDSHNSLAIVNKSLEDLRDVDLLPFDHLHYYADVIMTGHLFVPVLDNRNCVTFSRKIIMDGLRRKMGFEGLIMTDSLAMQGILNEVISKSEAAIKSLKAGHDLLLLGGGQLNNRNEAESRSNLDEILEIHQAIVDAVRTGRISETQVDESVNRILRLKCQRL